MLTREDLEAFIEDGQDVALDARVADTATSSAPRAVRYMSMITDAQMSFFQTWQRSFMPRFF